MEALWNIKHDSTLVCSIGLFALRRSSLSTTSPVALIEELSLLLVSDSLIIEIVPPLQVLFRQSCFRRMLVKQLESQETIRDDLCQEINCYMVWFEYSRRGKHALKVDDSLLLHREECELLEALLEFRKGIMCET